MCPSATYTAHATGFFTGPATFRTDAAGAGSVRVHNVSTSPYTAAVTAQINCPGNQGD